MANIYRTKAKSVKNCMHSTADTEASPSRMASPKQFLKKVRMKVRGRGSEDDDSSDGSDKSSDETNFETASVEFSPKHRHKK